MGDNLIQYYTSMKGPVVSIGVTVMYKASTSENLFFFFNFKGHRGSSSYFQIERFMKYFSNLKKFISLVDSPSVLYMVIEIKNLLRFFSN